MNETLADILGFVEQDEEVSFLFELATDLEDKAYKAEQVDDLLEFLREDLGETKAFTDSGDGGYMAERFRMSFTLLTVAQERVGALYNDLMQLAKGVYQYNVQAKEKASAGVGAHTGAQDKTFSQV